MSFHATFPILIAGAGIGGLAAGLALQRRGWQVQVIERTKEFAEIGAGIQLGPHAMKILRALGLEQEVLAHASLPESLLIADAHSGQAIHKILLGNAAFEKFSASYVSIHRADLHGILLRAARAQGIVMHAQQTLLNYELLAQNLRVKTTDFVFEPKLLIGADGLWSKTRELFLADGVPRATGHRAFRALIPSEAVPKNLRTTDARTWWGQNVHAVFYPLRQNRLYNLVVLAQSTFRERSRSMGWNLPASQSDALACFPEICVDLKALVQASECWSCWHLFDRPPIKAEQMASDRVALLGDAAHPMLPYMAQGAAMALEDAFCLSKYLHPGCDVMQALQSYANKRAPRNARVMQAATRNGQIFHLAPPWNALRNTALRMQGTRTLGLDWLYGYELD